MSMDFKSYRILAGYSLKDAACLIEIKKDSLYKIEKGLFNPSTKVLNKMRELYKCSGDELLDIIK